MCAGGSNGEQRIKGGEVEGQAKDGTGGWDEVVGSIQSLFFLLLAARSHPIYTAAAPRSRLRAPHHHRKNPTDERASERSSPFLDRSRQRRRSSRGAGSGRRSKMSWQTYVDDHLMCEIEGHHLTSAAIIGLDGTVWAKSDKFPEFKPEEMSNIMKDFDEPGFLAPTGLFLGTAKYMVIQGEPGAVIRGKKGSGGVTVKKTGQAVVIGIYDEPMTPGQCNMVVERLGDYLIEQGL